MEEQLELEEGVQQEMAASGDFLEGVTAFLQKRPAAFDGPVSGRFPAPAVR